MQGVEKFDEKRRFGTSRSHERRRRDGIYLIYLTGFGLYLAGFGLYLRGFDNYLYDFGKYFPGLFGMCLSGPMKV